MLFGSGGLFEDGVDFFEGGAVCEMFPLSILLRWPLNDFAWPRYRQQSIKEISGCESKFLHLAWRSARRPITCADENIGNYR